MSILRRRIRLIVWLLLFSYGFFPAQASIEGWPASSTLFLFTPAVNPPGSGSMRRGEAVIIQPSSRPRKIALGSNWVAIQGLTP